MIRIEDHTGKDKKEVGQKMNQDRIVISDCNHIAFEEEKQVARENGVGFELHDLLYAEKDQIIREIGDCSVIGCQRLPMTGELFDSLPNLKCVVRYGVGKKGNSRRRN